MIFGAKGRGQAQLPEKNSKRDQNLDFSKKRYIESNDTLNSNGNTA